jgi:hypothetical protein
MICYKDKTYCSSSVKEHACGREITDEEKEHAERIGLPIAYGEFCTDNDEENV